MATAFYFDKCPIKSGKLSQGKTKFLTRTTETTVVHYILPTELSHKTTTEDCHCMANISLQLGEEYIMTFESPKGGLEKNVLCIGKVFGLHRRSAKELMEYLGAKQIEEVDV
jgi:hypothetical protein